MKNLCLVLFLLVTKIIIGQKKLEEQNFKRNYLTFTFKMGGGFGFNKNEVTSYTEYDNNDNYVDSGMATISAGGGYSFDFGLDYVYQSSIAFGLDFGIQTSTLSPILDDAHFRFRRFKVVPTIKYMIGLTPTKDQTLNIGIGYGFYNGARAKFDLTSIDPFLKGESKYKNSSGLNLITEYQMLATNGIGFVGGLRYYGVDYDTEEIFGEREWDILKGAGIDIYLGITIEIKKK